EDEAVLLRTSSGHVLTVDDLLGLHQGVEVGGAQNQNDVVLAGVHILLLHLGEQTGQGRVDRSGVRAVGRRDVLRGAALVARGAVRRRRQQGGLDGLAGARL